MKTIPKLEVELDAMEVSNLTDLNRLVKLLWVEKFNRPPNDGRLLSLTLREAAEQVFEQTAFSSYMKKRAGQKAPAWRDVDEWAAPEVETVTGEEAERIADVPHLTGDAEWDAVELAETDPTRALLSERLGDW